jgi:uncharacterized phage protein gp47/JayE
MVFGRIEEVQDEYQAKEWLPQRLNLNKGVIRGLLEVFCWCLYQLYAFLAEIFLQAAPKDATGEWCDWHAEQIEIIRKPAKKAKGNVVFSRSTTSGNVPIPKGRVLKTPPDGTGQVQRFITVEDGVILDDNSQAVVAVESEEYGAATNVTAGQIAEIVTVVPGVESVTNLSDWLTEEGADIETDRQMHERYELRWRENNGCNKYAYKSWAMAVPGVIAVEVMDQHPRGQGTVDVVVKSSAGVPTEVLLDSVRDFIVRGARDESEQAGPPINDDWKAKGPTPVPLALSVNLELKPGYDGDTAKGTAEKRLRAMFLDPNVVDGVDPLQIGEDVPMDLLKAVAMGVPGVKKTTWTSPTADTPVAADGLAILESLNIETAPASEK